MKKILFVSLLMFLCPIIKSQQVPIHPNDDILMYINTIEDWLHVSDSLKIKMIEHLLSKKGDKRKNEVWFGYTNEEEKSHAGAVSVNKTYYYPAGTNQFVALYLISALYYSNLEFCERVEIIYKEKHTTTNLEITRRYKYKVVRNNIIRKMYREYEAWFKNLNGTSLSESPPLEDSKFRWD
ncbi:MAG: hypothetical protein AB8B69_24920 [Chitinophagales bacterium]